MNKKFVLHCFWIFSVIMFQSTAEVIAQQSKVKTIPLRDFFRNPEKSSFRLSPDGTKLAFMQPWDKRMNVFVQEIGKSEITQVTFLKERSIAGFFW